MNTTSSTTSTAIVKQTNGVLKQIKGKKNMRDRRTVELVKPQRDEKGQFIEGNQESKGLLNSGPPCKFCDDRTNIISKVNLYIEKCNGNLDGKVQVPYIEELCLVLGIHTDTLADWMNPPDTSHIHEVAELIRAYKSIKMMQKLRLMQTTLTNTATGAIFQLKANHGMVETEKTLIAGVNNEPVKYEILIGPKKHREELEEE